MPLNFWILILLVSLEPFIIGFSWIVIKRKNSNPYAKPSILGNQPYSISRSLITPLLFLSPTWWIPGLFSLLPPLVSIYPYSLAITIAWILINIKIGISIATIMNKGLNYYKTHSESNLRFWLRRSIGTLTTVYYFLAYIQIIQYLISIPS